MTTVRSRGWVAAPIDEVFAFFDDPRNLGRLMPPLAAIELVGVDPAPLAAGSLLTFRYGMGPWRWTWMVRLLERQPPHRLVDETISGPMARFHHTHRFTPARRGTWISDEIEFRVGPEGRTGAVLDRMAVGVMWAIFVWRKARQRQLLRG